MVSNLDMKGKSKIYLTISIIILILISILSINIFFTNKETGENTFSYIKEKLTKNSENKETNNINLETTDNPTTTSGGGEGSSGSLANSFCYNKQATYSIGNINEYYFCNLVESGSCVDKTAKCSVKVQNLDGTISGNFEIQFSFFEKENRSNVVEISSANSFIAPNEEKILKAELVIQGSNANKNLSCYYSTTEVPKKEICS